MEYRKPIRRVDFQVSLFTAAIIMLSVFAMAYFSYSLTYRDMIHSLQDTVFSIYSYLDTTLDKSSFQEINEYSDKQKEAYQSTADLLIRVKNATGVKYLYTAKENESGNLIYVVDGLDPSSEDFRNPGDLIEPEIQENLRRALHGEKVLPDSAVATDWGKIFISYFPIHGDDGTSVIGAIGIEIDAEHQYNTYRKLRIFTPVIIVTACLVCIALAIWFFRKLSNPSFRDMSNTDYLTQLKNRNAYDVALRNIDARNRQQDMGIIMVDLNNLKKVNDTEGHAMGDRYLQSAADTLRRSIGKQGIVYRIGGDEFAAIIEYTYEKKLEQLAYDIGQDYAAHRLQSSVPTSLAVGFALFNPQEKTIRNTVKRADSDMYEKKRTMYRK